MKIYLAARYSRHEEMQGYAHDLIAMGHEITSRWIWGGHQVNDHDLKAEEEAGKRQQFAEEDYEDVQAADMLIFFSEAQRTPTRGGRHVEMGLALGFGMRILVVGERENIFHALPEHMVEHYSAWSAAWAQLYNEWQQEYYGGPGTTRVVYEPEELCETCDDDCGEPVPRPPTKDDSGKLPYELMSTHALREYAEVLKFGADKYGARNWEEGLDYSRLYGAALRHMQAWWSGQDVDDGVEGSGRTHLAGAMFSIAALIHFVSEAMHDFDDRPFVSDSLAPCDMPSAHPEDYKLEFAPAAPADSAATKAQQQFAEQNAARFDNGPRIDTSRVTLEHVRPGATPADDVAHLRARQEAMSPPNYDWVTTHNGTGADGQMQRVQTYMSVSE